MRRLLLILSVAFLAVGSYAEKLPKDVLNARQAVASVITYKQGVMLKNGTAVFVGEKGELLSSRSLFAGADSAVVIDSKGLARPVRRIVGVNEMFDCIKVCVAADKKIKGLSLSAAPVSAGEKIYIVGYGIDKGGFVEPANVERVDSAYSTAYYTLAKQMEPHYLSLPLVNNGGELVAFMQEAATGDTINSYAVGAAVFSLLNVSVPVYGNGFYPSMGIRTALPQVKEEALSCLYMQTVIGNNSSYRSIIDDFIAAFPDSYEGYLAKAEHEAIVLADMNAAELSWEKAFKLAETPAEVHYGKAKVISAVVFGGDTVSHPVLTFANALAEIEKAIAADRQPLYLSCKAGMLYSHGDFALAAECYEELAATDLRSPEYYSKASQCYNEIKEYGKSVAMLDSALNSFSSEEVKDAAPYILTRALVNVAANKYRDAVLDYNRYEEAMGGSLGANFYYFREQAEVKAKMYQLALNDIDTAIDLDPLNIAYYIEKGLLCYRVKLTDEGIRVLGEALEFAPDAPDVHYLLGRLHVQKGEKDKALTYLKRALELGHPDAEDVMQLLDD